jgi:hypothetical protein
MKKIIIMVTIQVVLLKISCVLLNVDVDLKSIKYWYIGALCAFTISGLFNSYSKKEIED